MITIAADVGGTVIKLGIVVDGKIVQQAALPAMSNEGLSRRLPDIAKEIDLAQWAQTHFSLPLILENDTRLALLGEWRAGAGIGCDNLVLVTLGTGLGTAAVVEGRLVTGVHGQAGVLGGHFSTNRKGARCTCGNVGCAEAEASTSVLARIAAQHPEFGTSMLRTRNPIDYSAVFELARQGDSCALALRSHGIEVWAQMIVNLIHAYDPERVILGGGIMAGAADFLEDLTAIVLSRAHTPWGRVEVVAGALGPSAALLGLDALARQRFPEPA